MNKLYRSRNPFVRYVHTKRLQIIKELAEYDKKILLDCGCGEGHLLSQLSGKKYGVDYSPTAVKRAEERNPDAEIFKEDITLLPFEDGFFDIAICSEVLEHILDYKAAISEIKRAVRRNGQIIISVPNERNWTVGRLAMLRFPIKIQDHVNSFTPSQLIELFGSKPKRAVYIPFYRFSLSLIQIYEFENTNG